MTFDPNDNLEETTQNVKNTIERIEALQKRFDDLEVDISMLADKVESIEEEIENYLVVTKQKEWKVISKGEHTQLEELVDCNRKITEEKITK